MARSWKLARRQGNYWTSNILLFERNWAKDYEDTAKIPTIGNNARSRFTDQNKLLTKNNTNMMSHSQDKLLMLRSWKSVRRWGNYRTSNPFLFERNLTKTMKIQLKTQQWLIITRSNKISCCAQTIKMVDLRIGAWLDYST